MIFDLIGEASISILKFLGRIIIEVVLEFFIQGTGYIICRVFTRNDSNPKGGLEALESVVGIVFWIAVGFVIYGIKNHA